MVSKPLAAVAIGRAQAGSGHRSIATITARAISAVSPTPRSPPRTAFRT